MANVTRRANKDGTTSYRVKVSAGLGADGRYVPLRHVHASDKADSTADGKGSAGICAGL